MRPSPFPISCCCRSRISNLSKWWAEMRIQCVSQTHLKENNSAKFKNGLSFFTLTSNLIYLAMWTPGEVESCAFTQQEDSCMSNVAAPWTLKKGTGREHTGQKVEDTKRRSLHDRGSLTCSNSAPSLPACWSHSACEQPHAL